MKKLAIVLLTLSISACSTVSGIGKDIQKSSEWVSDKMSGTPLK
jgi:predicted small secreted protein